MQKGKDHPLFVFREGSGGRLTTAFFYTTPDTP